jgi:hypothetical protein
VKTPMPCQRNELLTIRITRIGVAASQPGRER